MYIKNAFFLNTLLLLYIFAQSALAGNCSYKVIGNIPDSLAQSLEREVNDDYCIKDEEKYQEDVQKKVAEKIAHWLYYSGYPFASFSLNWEKKKQGFIEKTASDSTAKSLLLFLEVQKKGIWYWGDMLVAGNSRSSAEVVSRLVEWPSEALGRVYSPEVWEEAQAQLLQHPYFIVDTMQLLRAERRNVLHPLVRLRDAASSQLVLSGGAGKDQWNARVKMLLLNIKGSARDLELDYERNEEQQYLFLKYKEPWVFQSSLSVEGNVLIDEQKEVYSRIAGEGALVWPIRSFSIVRMRNGWERSEYFNDGTRESFWEEYISHGWQWEWNPYFQQWSAASSWGLDLRLDYFYPWASSDNELSVRELFSSALDFRSLWRWRSFAWWQKSSLRQLYPWRSLEKEWEAYRFFKVGGGEFLHGYYQEQFLAHSLGSIQQEWIWQNGKHRQFFALADVAALGQYEEGLWNSVYYAGGIGWRQKQSRWQSELSFAWSPDNWGLTRGLVHMSLQVLF